MKIIQINHENESIFWDYVNINNRIEEFFFFVLDFRQFPEHTKINMAFDKNDVIQGILLIWKDRTLQIRGSPEAAKELLKIYKQTPKEVSGLKQHRSIIEATFPKMKLNFEMTRMCLRKGEENLNERYSSVSLKESDREEINNLMKRTDPIYWGDRKAEDLQFGANQLWIGIKNQGKIVSANNIWVDEKAGIVSIVVTDPEFQNRGYASTLVSTSLKTIFEKSSLAMIHVRADNAPAVHTYKKSGYKPVLDLFNYSSY